MKSNFLHVIHPYRSGPLWAFDDKSVGLKREALVCGADVLCEQMSGGDRRFTLMFAGGEFPGWQLHLKLKKIEKVGQTYITDDKREAWLCPALLLYFTKPPKHIYAQAVRWKETLISPDFSWGTCK